MQDALALQMELFGSAMFSGVEIAAMIRAVDTRALAAAPPAET